MIIFVAPEKNDWILPGLSVIDAFKMNLELALIRSLAVLQGRSKDRKVLMPVNYKVWIISMNYDMGHLLQWAIVRRVGLAGWYLPPSQTDLTLCPKALHLET